MIFKIVHKPLQQSLTQGLFFAHLHAMRVYVCIYVCMYALRMYVYANEISLTQGLFFAHLHAMRVYVCMYAVRMYVCANEKYIHT